MFARVKSISLLTVILTTLLFGCATTTPRSADIPYQTPHPSPITNFQVVDSDGIYRSGQPRGEADWKYLEDLGITTVIRLNEFSPNVDEAEELRMAKAHNISVVRIYMQPEDWPHNWNPWVRPDSTKLMEAVAILENRGNKKILVHCSHGKDRTGLVVAIYSIRDKNFCKDAAYKQMRDYGANPILFGLKSVLDGADIVQHQNCLADYK
ncbi:MAG: tyrosine-protein phosphatase [Rhodanobacter sp.]